MSDDRATWSSKWHFLLATISFAVGLGNIWRFPSLAYENGGGAFLIPYLTCSFLIGFPLLYLELTLGQYARCGPAVIYGRIQPFFQGIGWAMVCMSLLICIYYNMVVAWGLLYIFTIITGNSYQWSSCENNFNTAYCSSSMEDARCTEKLSLNSSNSSLTAFYFNGSCYWSSDLETMARKNVFFNQKSAVSPAEEFFENYILERSPGMDNLDGLNFKLVIGYFIAWTITALVLMKGVKMIGRVSFFTATIPYLISVILFVRSITLPGAQMGLDFYLLKPDMSYVWKPTTWRNAATQVCYSLSIGFGGILSLSSYNPSDHNCYKDAAIITLADGFMSIFGGTAVFGVLGFMAHQLNVPINEVVQSGTGLAFVAYPEAMSRMPISWIWSLLFFIMLCTLGISTQFGFAETICTAIYDQFPKVRAHKPKVVLGVCIVLYCCGLIMATRAGIYYFNIFDAYSSSFALMVTLFIEVILITYVYGYKNYTTDLRSVLGWPRNKLSTIFGPTGHYVAFIWRIIAPIITVIIFILSLMTQITSDMTYGKGSRLYVFPSWSIVFGWFLSTVPLIFIPIFIFYNYRKMKSRLLTWKDMFKVQAKWPSFKRHQKILQKEFGPVFSINKEHNIRIVPETDGKPYAWDTYDGFSEHTKM
uniref:Uncharacterized protein n=1 Tax=Acrobeloides nanus TaxID=290746 RepID=A0A914CKV7_9BILA